MTEPQPADPSQHQDDAAPHQPAAPQKHDDDAGGPATLAELVGEDGEPRRSRAEPLLKDPHTPGQYL